MRGTKSPLVFSIMSHVITNSTAENAYHRIKEKNIRFFSLQTHKKYDSLYSESMLESYTPERHGFYEFSHSRVG